METGNKRKREDSVCQASHERAHAAEVQKKAPRRIGPAPPFESVNERSSAGEDDDSPSGSSSDDDYGPTMPPPSSAVVDGPENSYHVRGDGEEELRDAGVAGTSSRSQRDSWMLTPPVSNDWAARLDTTKIRSRKFQTGKSARNQPQSSGSDSIWTETPDQKMRRLHNEMMGVAKPVGDVSSVTDQSMRDKISSARTLDQIRVCLDPPNT